MSHFHSSCFCVLFVFVCWTILHMPNMIPAGASEHVHTCKHTLRCSYIIFKTGSLLWVTGSHQQHRDEMVIKSQITSSAQQEEGLCFILADVKRDFRKHVIQQEKERMYLKAYYSPVHFIWLTTASPLTLWPHVMQLSWETEMKPAASVCESYRDPPEKLNCFYLFIFSVFRSLYFSGLKGGI